MPFWNISRSAAKQQQEQEEEENLPRQPLCVPTIKDPSLAGKKELLGVSVFHLETGLLESARAAGFSRESSIYQLEDLRGPPGLIRTKGQDTICPIDGRPGAAYVHCLNNEPDHVGDANFMLSYTWGYTLGDIIDALQDFCARHGYDPRRTYMWICFLCFNQHRVVEKRKQGLCVPTSVFWNEFQTRVLGIGRLLPLLTPWQQPTYLTRTWCIFEIFTAMERGVEIEILMPPSERVELSSEIFEEGKGRGAFALYDALLRTKLEHTEASEKQDREMILELLENATGGVEQTNVRVNDYLRQWFRREIIHLVEEKERAIQKTTTGRNKQAELLAYANLCRAVGILFWRSSESDDALIMHRKALASFEQVYGDGAQHHEIARTLSSIGSVHWMERRHTEALDAYYQALYMYQLADGDNHNDVAVAHMNIGTVLQAKGDHDGAISHHHKALELFDDKEYQNIATCHNNIGSTQLAKGNYDDAFVSVEKTIDIRRALLGRDNPDTARAFANLAVIHQLRGDPEAALIANERALQVSRVVFGEKHPDTASLHDNRGIMLQSKGDLDASLEEHEKARAIFQEGDSKPDRIRLGTVCNNIGKALWRQGNYNRALENYGLAQEMYMFGGLASDHPFMSNTLNNVGLVMASRGDHISALSVYQKALTLREAKQGTNHPQTAETLVDMGRTIHAQGDLDKARIHFERAMRIQEDKLGAGHKKTMETKEWIAKCDQSD